MTNKEMIKAIKSNYPTSGYTMLKKALDKSIELLERDIAKKPNGMENDWACPNCDSDRGMVSHGVYHEHCSRCGQLLDWSDTK